MFYNYNGVRVHYEIKREGKREINIFLHGWQREGKDFNELIETQNIKDYLLIDFPPFGESGDISKWNMFTYVNMLISLMDYLKIDKCNLIGHSFGGRVAIILSALKRDRVNKTVLLNAAGMKSRWSLKKFIKIQTYKFKRHMGYDVSKYGSNDYLALSSEMREVFKSVVSTYLEEYAKQIECQTLIIYGEMDCETPVYMAKRLNKLIKNSRLEIIKNAGHFCFIESKFQVGKMIKEYLLEE